MHHTDREGPRWLVTGLVDPLLLALICTCFFWKLVLTNQYTWLESPDLAYQVLPWFQFQAGEWHAGHFPLWDPYLWNGQPLLGQAQPGAAYPLNWLLFLAPLRNGWIRLGYLHWYFVAIHWMAAVFCYWLCRDLRRGRIAALFGGSLFALSGFMGTTDWPQMLNGAVWIPLVILFLLRALRGERPISNGILAGVFWGVSWLGGHHQVPIFLSLTVGALCLYHAIELQADSRLGFRIRWHVVRLTALAAAFAVAAGALQILPAVEYGKLAIRWVGAQGTVGWNDKVPYIVHREYSFNPVSVLGVIVPGWHRNSDAFMGSVALALAALATSLLWRDRLVRLFFAIAIGGLLFALGDANVIHGILYSLIPMVEKARSPGMATVMFNFGISVLTAYGIDLYHAQASGPMASRIAKISAAVGCVLLAVSFGRASVAANQRIGDERAILVGLCALGVAGLLYAWSRQSLGFPALAAFTFGLMIFEVGLVTTAQLPHREERQRNTLLPKMQENSDIVEFLRQQGFLRVVIDDEAIPYNFGDWYGVETYRGYLASVTVNLIRTETEMPLTPKLFGVKYSVKKSPDNAEQIMVFRGKSGLNVYLNPGALPRVWSVHEIATVKHEGEARNAIQTLDVRHKAFVFGPPPPVESCPSEEDEVRLTRHAANRVSIEASMRCRGMVLLSDTAYPGWVARVDGKEVPIHDANLALRGVIVDAGKHRIEMTYRPRSVIVGASLSLSAWLAAAGIGVASLRRRPVA